MTDAQITKRRRDSFHSSLVGVVSITETSLFGWREYAPVLSRDGQGGALLRVVAKLVKSESDTVEALEMSYWDVQQLCAAMAAALVTCTRGEVATLVRSILSVVPGNGLHAWRAVTGLDRDQWWNKLRRWRVSYRPSAPRV